MSNTTCEPCALYIEKRLPVVQRLWRAETGQGVNVVRFMDRVHFRHINGLPILSRP